MLKGCRRVKVQKGWQSEDTEEMATDVEQGGKGVPSTMKANPSPAPSTWKPCTPGNPRVFVCENPPPMLWEIGNLKVL